MNNIKSLMFLLIISIVSTPSYAGSKEGKIEWAQVQINVQQTIIEHAQGGKIKRIKKEKIILLEKVENKKTTLYLAKIRKTDGGKAWLTVDKSGELIDIEGQITERVLEDIENEKNEKNN